METNQNIVPMGGQNAKPGKFAKEKTLGRLESDGDFYEYDIKAYRDSLGSFGERFASNVNQEYKNILGEDSVYKNDLNIIFSAGFLEEHPEWEDVCKQKIKIAEIIKETEVRDQIFEDVIRAVGKKKEGLSDDEVSAIFNSRNYQNKKLQSDIVGYLSRFDLSSFRSLYTKETEKYEPFLSLAYDHASYTEKLEEAIHEIEAIELAKQGVLANIDPEHKHYIENISEHYESKKIKPFDGITSAKEHLDKINKKISEMDEELIPSRKILDEVKFDQYIKETKRRIAEVKVQFSLTKEIQTLENTLDETIEKTPYLNINGEPTREEVEHFMEENLIDGQPKIVERKDEEINWADPTVDDILEFHRTLMVARKRGVGPSGVYDFMKGGVFNKKLFAGILYGERPQYMLIGVPGCEANIQFLNALNGRLNDSELARCIAYLEKQLPLLKAAKENSVNSRESFLHDLKNMEDESKGIDWIRNATKTYEGLIPDDEKNPLVLQTAMKVFLTNVVNHAYDEIRIKYLVER